MWSHRQLECVCEARWMLSEDITCLLHLQHNWLLAHTHGVRLAHVNRVGLELLWTTQVSTKRTETPRLTRTPVYACINIPERYL